VDGEVRFPAGGGGVHRLRPASEKRKDLLVIRELAEASALVPVVGACYPLARIADAYRHVDAGHKKGTIVVAMS
jgi:NADPH:quinone reductase-like Zn-dependent oxidoreductase